VFQRKEEYSKAEKALLDRLDAYGHCSYSVGGTYDDDGDWNAFGDFVVGKIDGKKVVAYHVVVNSDSGGFIDTVESDVVDAANAPKGLLYRYVDSACEQGNLAEGEYESSMESAARFDADLLEVLKTDPPEEEDAEEDDGEDSLDHFNRYVAGDR
jgi:hypothetical protein